MKAAKKLKSKFGGGGMATKFKKKPVGLAASNPPAVAPKPVEKDIPAVANPGTQSNTFKVEKK